MIDYISISTLNDFIFCPYSIYLHNVYMEADETMYHAAPQTKGKVAHETVDRKTASNRSDDILALPVYSEEYGLMGKIDVYKQKEKKLIERKYQLKQICRVFFDALIPYKSETFRFVQQYYRCFMGCKYEVNNPDRVLENLKILIEDKFAKDFDGGDSVIIFDVSGVKLKKYGNAIHRDTDIVYF